MKSNKRKILKYTVISILIFTFFWVSYLFKDIKTANKMLPVSIKFIDTDNKTLNSINIYRISPKKKIDLFERDINNIFYINRSTYIKEIKIEFLLKTIEDINDIEIIIGKNKYIFLKNDYIKKIQIDKNSSELIFDFNDFKESKKSSIPIFYGIINWPGDFNFFILSHLLLFFIILISSILIYFSDYIISDNYLNIIKKNKSIKISIIVFIFIAINLIYFQDHLYVSNQNTKFLHGLAKAGYGYLNKDWLANTVDPLPVFSFLVYITYCFFSEYLFYLYFMIIFSIYIYSLIQIGNEIFQINKSKLKLFIYFFIIIIFHSKLFIHFFYKVYDINIISLFFEGTADQYLIGNIFQPCLFGVFILLSIYLFLKKKTYLSIIFLIITCTFHTAYIFSSGILTLTYILTILIYEKNLKKGILVGLLALILVIPTLIYNYIYLGSSSSEISKEALDIIVNIRIPHHSLPLVWIRSATFIKALVIIISLYIVRKKKIFIIMFLPFLIAVVLTILQIFLNNNLIGMLAPWRFSTWLMPISSCIIIGYLISFIDNKYGKQINLQYKKITLSGLIIFFIMFSYGISYIYHNFDIYLNINNGPLLNYVKKNKSSNDNYLVPTGFNEFRLETGAPTFVTFKSHPYKDFEVIEWYKRFKLAEEFYSNLDSENIYIILNNLEKSYGITHVVIPFNYNVSFNPDFLQEIHKDNQYILFKIVM